MKRVLTLLAILSAIEFKSAKTIAGFASDANVSSDADFLTTGGGYEDATQYTTFGTSENTEINFIKDDDESNTDAAQTTDVSTLESTTCTNENCMEIIATEDECGLEILDVAINRTKNSFAMTLTANEKNCDTRYYIHLTKAHSGGSKDVPYFRRENRLFHKFKKKLLQCTAYNVSIEVGYVPVFERVIWTLPGEVKNVTVSVKKNETEVAWPASPHPDCSDYYIYADDRLVGKTSKTSYKFNGQLYCTKFGVSIVGRDNNVGRSITGIEPGPVKNLHITPDSNSLSVSWEPPENNCATSYLVTLGTSASKETTATTYVFNNLQGCTSYTVTVSAQSESTPGESTSASATTGTPAQISGVTNLKLVVVDDALNVTWEAPYQQEACIKEYRVLLWDDENETHDFKTSEKYYEFRPLVGCMTYNVQITPIVTASQEGQLQMGQHKVEPLRSTPPTLKNIDVDKTWAVMVFELIAFSENRCVITKVSVSCDGVNNENHPWIVQHRDAFLDYADSKSRPNANITVDGLSEYTNYRCVAVVENEGGISDNSEPIEFQTDSEVPGAPRNLIVTTMTDTGFTVEWDEPEKVPGILENYKIETIRSKSMHYIPEECSISGNKDTDINEPADMIHDVDDAFPNFEYIIEVSAKTIDYGPLATLNVYTSPAAPELPRNVDYDFINILGETYDVTFLLNWSTPCNTNGNLSSFTVETFGESLENSEETFHDLVPIDINDELENNSYNWTLPGIQGNFNYTVLIKAIVSSDTGGIDGEAYNINFLSPDGFPSAPVNVRVGDETDKSAVVSWDEPLSKNGELQEYNVTIASVRSLDSHVVPDDCDVYTFYESYVIPSSEVNFKFEDGVPNYEYSVVITASTNAGFGMESDVVIFRTTTSNPEAVRQAYEEINFIENENYNAHVTISFSKPCALNGDFVKYNVTLTGTRNGFNEVTLETIVEEYANNTVTFDLKPQYEYTGGIQVINDEFASETYEIDGFTAPAGVPIVPAVSELQVPEASGSQTANFVLTSDLFDITNGDILYYGLIISRGENEENVTDGVYGFWNGSTWPTIGKWSDEGLDFYQTNEEFWNPFVNKDVNNYTYHIGTENCTGATGFCNGPLTPATTYDFRVRGFTNRGYRDTKTVRFVTPEDLEDSLNWALILGLLFGLLALMILILFICCLWRKKKKEKDEKIVDDTPHVPMAVTIKQFPENYDNYKQNLHKFKEEFSLVSKWSTENMPLTTIGLTEENKKKNRYINVLPQDDTRVTLASDKNANYTDYINASYIKGYSGSIEYIATQGPLESTDVDFWRMVMQENVSVIVMVAQFVEQSKQKCHKYFPDNHEIMEIGDGIEIRCSNELNFGEYIVRNLLVQRELTQWTITHLQFIDWPDFGCPNGTRPMLQFCNVMRQHMERDKSKTIIHCSAGVGRTGTLIAIDILLQTIENNGDIDVFKTVCNLRMQRPHMVQTEKQYVYIHSCINDSILNPVKAEEKKSEPIYENIDLLQEMLNDKVVAESAL